MNVDLAQFEIPSTREESWRYTNVSGLRRIQFEPPRPVSDEKINDILSLTPELDCGSRLVFAQGAAHSHFFKLGDDQKFSQAVSLETLSEVARRCPGLLSPRYLTSSERHFVRRSNDEGATQGAVIVVSKRTILAEPIVIHYLALGDQATQVFYRNVVVVEAGAQAVLVERFASRGVGPSFLNSVTDITLERGASLEHYRFHENEAPVTELTLTSVAAAEGSHYRSHVVSTGGAICRDELYFQNVGPGANGFLSGLALGEGRSLIDHHTEVVHRQPHGRSEQNYRSILRDQARGVFHGRVKVSRRAQKTDAAQITRTLLLSPSAEMNARPELEILADDVKCTHGATIGQLDEEALFYLRSRGLSAVEAERILTEAFAAECLQAFRFEALRRHANALLSRYLSPRGLELSDSSNLSSDRSGLGTSKVPRSNENVKGGFLH